MKAAILAKGKWINISEVRFSNDIEIITFEKGELEYRTYYFEFGKPSLQPSKVKNYFGKVFNVNFDCINDNRIRFHRNGLDDNEVHAETTSIYTGNIKSQDYVRLFPTVLRIEKSKIQRLKYVFYWRGENHLIKFNESLDLPEIQVLNEKIGNQGKRMLIEKAEKTLLISLYINGKRKLIFPIKEIDESKAFLYGLTEKPFEVVAVRLGEEENSQIK